MIPIRLPVGVPFPAVAYDAIDDALVFDLGAIGALVEANPHLEWSEDLLIQLLANWCLRNLDAGLPVGPAAAVLRLAPRPGHLRSH